MKTVLSIAGSDSGGGAGIQADLKTFEAHGVYGMTAITALTAQNTLGIRSISEVSAGFLAEQIDACLEDIGCDAVKIGMLPSAGQVEIVADRLKKYKVSKIVLDPVMVSTSGISLIKSAAAKKLSEILFPLCTVITPNIPEAEVLTGIKISNHEDMLNAAEIINQKYSCAVLLKGGHSHTDASDLLYTSDELSWFDGKRINNPNTHGTGCTLSSAIASDLALGFDLKESVRRSKEYITKAIEYGLNLGHGNGPLIHNDCCMTF